MTQYEEVHVRGFAEFTRAVSARTGKDVFAYFSGDKDDKGVSWCPDCVKALGAAGGEKEYNPQGSVQNFCNFPELPGSWKDPNNEFRKVLKLSGVPTLLRYGTPQKLVEEECFKADLVRMMFTED
uniref:Thioredoxin domain-containing protein 17 n=1 Tax=Lepisosteus oculatus TaxID=7918 RepID=W5MGS6_LEPOC